VNDRRERGYNRGGGNSRRKYSYDDDMSSRRGDWKCMEVNFYTYMIIHHFSFLLSASFDAFFTVLHGKRSWADD
jgi:hypothetical protein